MMENNTEFKLGPVQEAWLKSLEEHPERQMRWSLGIQDEYDSNKYQACCLGEGCIIARKMNNLPVCWDNGKLRSNGSIYGLSIEDTDLLGLHADGNIEGISLQGYDSLAEANDEGVTWPEIAKFIRENPTAVFKESK